ncbi:acetate--CoA ligase family protein [Dongia rigui]|uniref:Acetate--CoA ligase family protein n=1 Tax=Dongia rigui TaxID=940149 RepID=A0ABU5E4D6_9PROT|nr:acetate--CoA ligase family protein [Dongia rigui]MDY0874344.1 acetate--CoA ligase family protein [Dongia rigui]
MAHKLDRLLRPRSVALVGASPKEGSVGRGMITSTGMAGTLPKIYFVNPAYQEIDGQRCYPSLSALPETVDMAVLGIANVRLEAALDEAIGCGIGGVTIFASGYLENDTEPKLTERIAAKARAAGVAICGGNCMGFYHLDFGLRVCGFPPPAWIRKGNVAFITHSGSAFSALCHTDRRFGFSLAVSAGQELATNVADYLDFALDIPATKVVGLFLETVRDPAGFKAALLKAQRMEIPVVALKVGRTAESAALAVSHSGAVAGNHAAYQALFDRYGVIEVANMDELVNALHLFSSERRLAPGGLATMHDSGGFRELVLDLGIEAGVPFAQISDETRAKLAARLDYGLEPINPLDAWGTGNDWAAIFEDCLQALVDDPDTALASLCVEARDEYYLSAGYADILRRVAARTTKPVFYTTNVGSNANLDVVTRLAHDGVPVLSGVAPMLGVVKKAMAARDRALLAPDVAAVAPSGLREKWAPRLAQGDLLEAEALDLLADYGVPVVAHVHAETLDAAKEAADRIGYPIVLKTAMPGILHKSDVGGVKLGVKNAAELETAYADLKARLGPRVLLMPMAGKGVEISFGMTMDPQFGPVVMVGAGGVLIEMMSDRRFVLPPFGPIEAARHIEGLALRPLLDGKRGAKPADVEKLARAFAAFAVMVADLEGLVGEMDVNPLIVNETGAVAVDALIVATAR